MTEGAPFYFLGLTCARRHNAPRKTFSRMCVVCQEENHRKALQDAARARQRAAEEAAAIKAKEERRQAREVERKERARTRAMEKRQATAAAKKAATRTASGAEQPQDDTQGQAPPAHMAALQQAASHEDSPPWEVSGPSASSLSPISPDSSAPWDTDTPSIHFAYPAAL